MAGTQIKREAPEGFDQRWLACRAPYDAEARSTLLEARAKRYLDGCATSRVLDVGCGSGNNILFLAEKWRNIDRWLGLDHDNDLVTAAKQQTDFHQIPFTGVVADLLDLDTELSRHSPSLIVGNAVFDLFTPNMMEQVLSTLQKHRIPMLTTLSYTGMKWNPALELDSKMIGFYEQHMVRPRPSGRGMGPAAPQKIKEIVAHLGGQVESDLSLWRIPAEDQSMQAFLFHFMERSIPEVIESEIELENFREWLTLRKQTAAALSVTHEDLWITWS